MNPSKRRLFQILAAFSEKAAFTIQGWYFVTTARIIPVHCRSLSNWAFPIFSSGQATIVWLGLHLREDAPISLSMVSSCKLGRSVKVKRPPKRYGSLEMLRCVKCYSCSWLDEQILQPRFFSIGSTFMNVFVWVQLSWQNTATISEPHWIAAFPRSFRTAPMVAPIGRGIWGWVIRWWVCMWVCMCF